MELTRISREIVARIVVTKLCADLSLTSFMLMAVASDRTINKKVMTSSDIRLNVWLDEMNDRIAPSPTASISNVRKYDLSDSMLLKLNIVIKMKTTVHTTVVFRLDSFHQSMVDNSHTHATT